MKTSLIQSEKYQTIDELIAALKVFKTKGCNYIDIVAHDTDGNYLSIDGALVELQLLEEVLSDGSKAHDVKLTFSEYEV